MPDQLECIRCGETESVFANGDTVEGQSVTMINCEICGANYVLAIFNH